MLVCRLLALLTLLLVSAPCSAAAYATRHVVVVVIDGARYTETLGDPTFANVPAQGNVLAPQGCQTPFYNLGITSTCPGFATLFTGAIQRITNDGLERPHTPTVFEYYRAATGAPASDTWFVAGKPKLDILEHSDHPDYGAPFSASVDISFDGDADVMARARQHLFGDHPAILGIGLNDTDAYGHQLNWPGYLGGIHFADSLVGDLWARIQADTALAGRTSLFVTNDHGRHDDISGGYQNHGDGCNGCRRIELLAVGPDFKIGQVSTVSLSQQDLIPTIGVLLGIPTPLVQGLVMNPLLEHPFGDLGVEGEARAPRLAFAAASPNPADAGVRVSLALPAAGPLTVEVLDPQGRRVATLFRGRAEAGVRTLPWEGRDRAGARVPPGVYLVRARAGGTQAVTRVVMR